MKNFTDISQEEQELIDRYLSEELTPAEQKAFTDKMVSDASWNELVEECRLIRTGINEASLHDDMQKFHNELKIRSIAPVRKMQKKYWAVAASIVILISLGIIFFNKGGSSDRLYKEYFTPDPGLMTTMGATEDYEFNRAMVDYKTGDYKAALASWEQLLKDKPSNDTLNYFIGVAKLAAGDNEQAITHLQQVSTYRKGTFANDADWYLGLALINQNKTEEAKEYIQRSGHAKSAGLLLQLNKK